MTTLTALAPYPVFRDTTRASRPPAQMVASADREFEDLRRDAPDLGVNGVHPTAVKALIGVYGVLLLTFWAFFGGPETALTLGIITVLGVMFFGLLGVATRNNERLDARFTALFHANWLRRIRSFDANCVRCKSN